MSEEKEQSIDNEQQTTDNSQNTTDDRQQTTDDGQQTADEANPQDEQPKELTAEEKLEKAEQEIADLNDQLLRKIAEFDNYRKRTIKEKTELILNGGEKTIIAILPVIDDLERALKNIPKDKDVAAEMEGVELIYKKFLDILERQGVKTIKTENEDFNVDLHEAIAQLPAPSDEMKGKILDCTLTGYTMNDKVIRHAQVVVGL
jgi:molecular chaperone GrpE